MLDLDQLSVDPKLALEGKWVDYLKGSQLKVARINNKHAEQLRIELAIESADVLQAGGDKAEDKAFEIETQVLANHVLKDWSGMGRAKKETPYDVETGLKLLGDPRFSDLRDDLVRIARNRENYREEAIEAATDAVKTKAAS